MVSDVLSGLRTTKGMLRLMAFLCVCLLVIDLLYPKTQPYTVVSMIFGELIGVVIALMGIQLIIVDYKNRKEGVTPKYKDILILISIALVVFGVTVIVIAYNYLKGGW